MSVSVVTSPVLDALAKLEAAQDELYTAGLDRCADAEVLDVLQRMETFRRREASFDHALIAQVGQRHLDSAHGATSVRQLLRTLLRISPGEASARVRAAESMGPRVVPSGGTVEPIYPGVAAAQAAGQISPAHAAVITKTIEKLPAEVAAEWDRFCETTLVQIAGEHDPDELARQARTLAYRLDQDGQYQEAAWRDKIRDLRLRNNPDGSARLEADLTAETAERLRVMFDALAQPRPAHDGTPDPRTPGQRRHDALLDWLRLVEQAQLLPKTGGVAATVLLTMDLDTYGTGHGTARTGHGYTIPADLAKTWTEPECRIMLTLLSATKGIEAYSSVHRIFTEQQRLAMAARDRGCSYPHCDAPTTWADAHHVTDWKETHRTCVDDGALVCGKNHDTFKSMGYTSVMINGRAHWVPPKWIDPQQKPQRNRMHDH